MIVYNTAIDGFNLNLRFENQVCHYFYVEMVLLVKVQKFDLSQVSTIVLISSKLKDCNSNQLIYFIFSVERLCSAAHSKKVLLTHEQDARFGYM